MAAPALAAPQDLTVRALTLEDFAAQDLARQDGAAEVASLAGLPSDIAPLQLPELAITAPQEPVPEQAQSPAMAMAQVPMAMPANPMPQGVLVQAPEGFLSFCITHSADCAAEDDRQGEQAARFAHLELARRWIERVPLAATASLPSSITPEPFTAVSLAPSDEALPAPVGDLALLARVNTSINRRIRPMSDIQHYGVEDYWATPLEDGKGQAYGDCEDYALEKRRALIASGVAPRDLTMALALTRRGELHVVLLLSTSSGEYVADSLTDRILPWQDVPYTWIARQERGRPMVWRAASAAWQGPGRQRG